MYQITKAKKLADKIYLMDVVAPRVAANCLPGQFIIAKVDKEGERIPLTICDYDRENGTITIVFQIVGASTEKMSKLVAGDSFTDFVGPLGVASEFTKEDPEALKNKKFLFVAGGVGAAPVYPQVKWLHEHGIQADVIVGAKTQSLILLEEEMKAVGNVYITTDDGSYERKGMVTQVIQELHDQGKQYDVCVAIGPMIMMKFVCKLTKELGIPTIVSLNPIMVDGTGMCGGCRVSVGGEIKFACVDGPEFDGHLVNWDEAMMRQQTYKTAEGRAMLKELDRYASKFEYDTQQKLENYYKEEGGNLSDSQKQDLVSDLKNSYDSADTSDRGDILVPEDSKDVTSVYYNGKTGKYDIGYDWKTVDTVPETRTMEVMKEGQQFDRVGPPSGRCTGAVGEDGSCATVKERSIPYHFTEEDITKEPSYHRYQAEQDFTKENLTNAIDNSMMYSDDKKVEMHTNVDRYYENAQVKGYGDGDGLATGEIAPMFEDTTGATGGGKQYDMPLSMEELENIGMISEVEKGTY